jgi:hypothetical protein
VSKKYTSRTAVFEHEGLPHSHRLAVDLVGPSALVVLDPEVIADGQQPLAHEEPLASGSVRPMPQKSHQARLVFSGALASW